MDYLKLTLVILLSFEFLCLADSNSITSFFGKGDDRVEVNDKTTVNTPLSFKTAAGATTTPSPSSSCGGLKGFLNMCDKTENTEPQKSVKTRSIHTESDSSSSSDESKSNEGSDEKKSFEVTIAKTLSNNSQLTERETAKRQADDLNVTSETSESENILNVPVAPLPVELKKRQAESNISSESESVEEELNRKRRDCRDGPWDERKDCKK